jgi:hypothetical protein
MTWCVLRTAGRLTLRLADSLEDDGFDVWTPVEKRTMRIPRANIRRPVRLPIMPSYVFADARHLLDLLELANMPVKPRRGSGITKPAHPDFSVMTHNARIPMIEERQLVGLRSIEIRRNVDKRLPKGMDVKVKTEGGSFAGMHGRVEASEQDHTLVCFDGRMTVRVPTWLLAPSDIGCATIRRSEAA